MKKSTTKKSGKEPETVKIYLPKTLNKTLDRNSVYNVQSTADTKNEYPFIAQGYNKDIVKSDLENKSSKK